MAVEIARRRFTTKEFEQMIRAGVFLEDERIELIDGEIVEMAPINFPHAVCVSRIDHSLRKTLGVEAAYIWVQNPIQFKGKSRLQPDIAVLKWRDDLYTGKNPTPEDVLLLIEVAESSVRYDRYIKAPRYARAGIPELWIVLVKLGTVEVYTEPGETGFGKVHQAGRGESLPLPPPLDGSISIDDIFG